METERINGSNAAGKFIFPSANEYSKKDIDRVMSILDEEDPISLVDKIIKAMGMLARFEHIEPGSDDFVEAYYVLELHLKVYVDLIKSTINYK